MTQSETVTSGFDPAAVPVYPVMRLETGQGQVTVNGQPVTTRRGQSPMEAAIGLVAARAASANTRGVRVLVVDEGGREFWHVVDAEGGVHDLTEQQRPGGVAGRRRRRLGVLLLAAGVVVAFVLAGAVLVVARSSDGRVQARPTRTVAVKPSATATQLPALSVPGWSSVAVWGSPAVDTTDSERPAAVVTPGGKIFAVLRSGSSSSMTVARLSPTTGRPVWSVKVRGGQVVTGPQMATVAGRRVVLIATDSAVSAVDVSRRSVRSWPVPDGADADAVRLTSSGPVIPKSATAVTVLNAQGDAVDRSVPAGASAWWPLKNGKALAVDAAGHVWRSGSSHVAGKPARLHGPKKRKGAGTAAVAEGVLVQQWVSSGDSGSDRVVLVGYSTSDLKPLWTSKPVAASDSADTRVFGGRWLWTGSELVSLRTGKVTRLPEGVRVSAVDGDTVWALGNDAGLVAYDTSGHRKSAGETPAANGDTARAQVASPVGSAGGRLVVAAAAETGGDLRLYLLRAEQHAASSSSTASSSSAAPSSTGKHALKRTKATKSASKGPTASADRAEAKKSAR